MESRYSLKENATIFEKLETESNVTIGYWMTIAQKRLALIRSIYDLRYTYDHNDLQLLKHFREKITFDQIRSSGIVDCEVLYDSINNHNIPICKTEMELTGLLYHGFTPRELSYLYNHANPDSIYVKINRLKHKYTKYLFNEIEDNI